MKIIAILVLLGSGLVLSQVSREHSRSYIFGYITKGQATDIDSIPYQVAVILSANGKDLPYCGGSIISKTFVLSAAHCISLIRRLIPAGFPYRLKIRAGSSAAFEGGQVVAVAKAFVHPGYSSKRKLHDFALLALENELIFNDSVQPARLPSNPDHIVPTGTPVAVSGWGVTSADGERGAQVLQSVVLENFDPQLCVDFYKKKKLDLDKELIVCAGWTGGGKDSCHGDSGGPLTHEGALVGVVSFGLKCGFEGVPAVYGRVTKELNWINSTVNGVE